MISLHNSFPGTGLVVPLGKIKGNENYRLILDRTELQEIESRLKSYKQQIES